MAAASSAVTDEDEALLGTSKYRALRNDCEAALQAFEKAEEWADLIKYLQERASLRSGAHADGGCNLHCP